jgi:xanthine dehydrogenase YagS FAD-binding subunit
MRPFEYVSPAALDEAIAVLQQDIDGLSKPLAGGTDLLTLMKAEIAAPSCLVNIKRLGELSGVEDRPHGLALGALTRLAAIARHPIIVRRSPVLAEAAAQAATPQLRNMASLGGNLLQRPRCWYFRHRLVDCWLKGSGACPAHDGENQFHALFGGGPCYAVHPSDLAPALVALDAHVRLRGPGGERLLPVAELFALPEEGRRAETRLDRHELLLSVSLPPLPQGARSTYLKAMDRKVWAFALVSVAAVLRLDGRRIEDARLVLGGVAPIPWRVAHAERAMLGAEASRELFGRVADAALVGAQPLRQNAYKLPLAKALVRRALERLAGEVIAT